MEHDSDDCRAYLHSRGVSPPEKAGSQIFSDQADRGAGAGTAQRVYQKRHCIQHLSGSGLPAGGRSVWKNWRYEGFDSALGGNPSFSDLLTLAE